MISENAKKELVKMIMHNKDADVDALLSYSFYLLINNNDELSYYFAYSTVLHYGNIYGDYEPLSEFCIIFGYSPILDLLRTEEKYLRTEMQRLIANMFVEGNRYEDKILTSGQKVLFRLIDKKEDYSVVAPTSYGKQN